MKFKNIGGMMVEESNNPVMDKFNEFSDWVVGKEVELFLAPLGSFLKECGIALGHWFITNLPDIMGYSAVLAGICIIIGAMIGRGGMIKPLAGYAIALIIAMCILGGV